MAGLFLDQWAALSGVPHHTLVRIHPETRAIKANVFAWPSEREGALKWIEASNKTMNVYFSVNRARPINKKAEKCDIEALVAVHADVDPIDGADFCAERMRLMRLAAELAEREPAPTFILDSGGGIQAFYLTSYPTPADPPEYVAHVEGLSARLGCVLGARDRCWNVDRIMRLPATLNHPHKKKQARGRPRPLPACSTAAARRIPGTRSDGQCARSKTSHSRTLSRLNTARVSRVAGRSGTQVANLAT